MTEPSSRVGAKGSPAERTIALALRGLWKTYPGTVALAGADLEIAAGEVHALVGHNGSGKSTLIKVLAGVEVADEGQLEVAGEPVDVRDHTALAAHRLGLRFVHQQLDLLPDLTVAENIAIAQGYPHRAGIIRWRRVDEIARRAFETLNLEHIDPRLPLHRLRPAQQTMVAVARAVSDTGERAAIVLDEPTASLPRPEVDALFEALKQVRDRGHAILFVTHRLGEVLELADRATVLRDGRSVATFDTAYLDHDTLAASIVGRPVLREPTARSATSSEPFLEASDFAAGDFGPESFVLHPGEILGVAGLIGSGCSSLLRGLFGQTPRTSGHLELEGQPIDPASPKVASDLGLAYVSHNRQAEGLFPDESVSNNIVAARLRTRVRGLVVSGRVLRDEALKLSEALGVRSAGISAPIASLSGGNQQKCLIGRWLRLKPKVLLLDEPTHGVDIGACDDIHDLLRDAVGDTSAAIVTSSDMEELALVCDRVLVLTDGRITAELEGPALTVDRLEELCVAGPGTMGPA